MFLSFNKRCQTPFFVYTTSMFGKKKVEINTDPEKINAILNRGIITDILPSKEKFKEQLLSGKQLKLYWGVDATAPTLHLSHAKNFLLLEEFRKLGHQTIILFGDFTARIGDPTDTNNTRSRLTQGDVMANIKKWKELISPIVDFKDKVNPPKVVLNGKWLSKLSFEDVVDLASNFTVQQMIERDMFQKRIESNKPINLHEFLYPLMQGYDSVALDVDVECCGTDQTFNALAGRTLLKKYKNKEKYVVAVNLMENPVTKELMSKSRGTGVFLDTDSKTMYGSIMSQPDEMIEVLYINMTRLPLEKLESYKSGDPKEFKMFVAKNIVSKFYGDNDADSAEFNWIETFSKGNIPKDVDTVEVSTGTKLVDVLVDNNVVQSKAEVKRLISSGAVKFASNNSKVDSLDYIVDCDNTFKIGKRRFLRLKIRN